jgi:hypothetical protein
METISFTIISKKFKYLGVNLTVMRMISARRTTNP